MGGNYNPERCMSHSVGTGRRGITVLALALLILAVIVAAVFLIRYLRAT
jgi:uncharacterized membrane protein